jgi:serine/threonine-protein kinase
VLPEPASASAAASAGHEAPRTGGGARSAPGSVTSGHASAKTPTAEPTTPPAPTATPAATGKSDCNPPFYFSGTKKIFKPGCF